MKIKFLPFILLAMLCLVAQTSRADQKLTINGEQVDKVATQLTFDGDNVVLHFGDTQESYDMNSVTLSFEVADGISATSMFQLSGIVSGQLCVSGLDSGTVVSVFDAAGQLVARTTAQGTQANISTSHMKGGVYIMRAGNKAVKFVKR